MGREHFAKQAQIMSQSFEDSWSNSEKSVTEINDKKQNNSSVVPSGNSSGLRSLLMPRNWMMPKLFDDNLSSMMEMKDSNLLSMKNDDTKMEISLNTSGYKPSELKVNVADGEISIEGKREEKSEEGHTMVSRQFSRRYTLPAGAKLAEVESNLSQDGVMVITVPKDEMIQEIKDEKKTHKVQEDKNMNVEHKTSTARKGDTTQSKSLIPMTMRDSFFNDPFFKDTWLDRDFSEEFFFEQSRKRFEESMKGLKTNMISSNIFDENKNPLHSSAWTFPEIFGQNSDTIFSSKDSNQIRMVDDDTKLEISLDTTDYKPDELKVSAGQGLICVEGKYEAGQVMVSRQFSKKYSMPASAKAEEVISNLSQDGVLVVSVPKREAIKQENRSVPIEIK